MKQWKKRNVLISVLCGTFVSLGCIGIFAALYFVRNFDVSVGFDAVLFTLFSDLNGVNSNVMQQALLQILLPSFFVAGGFVSLFLCVPAIIYKCRGLGDDYPLLLRLFSLLLSVVLFGTLIAGSVSLIGLDKYVASRMDKTTLFEDEYVAPDSTLITFPEKKRNLIYIYLESMEVTYFSDTQNGSLWENVIPELYELAVQNLNFSQNDGVGGGQTTTGSTWTIAAMVSQSAGIPLCLPGGIWENGYNNYSKVLPGVTSLIDILHDNGYDQTLMVGSNASFGGRREYYLQHGADRVYDLYTAREEKIVPEEYHNGFWGMEDCYLFDYAKLKLTEISAQDDPFAFTLLTVDTHHPQGYLCSECDSEERETQFESVLSCSSRQVYAFVEWLKKQDFYENTTVIITGDHYSMNSAYIYQNIPQGYVRRVYNCFLNVPLDAVNCKNREFTTLDMFPTTLAALGCTVEGDRLGLGVNLFSEEKTLAERYGLDYLCAEINKTSAFYESNFLYGKRD